jgi:hypothetical protein
MQTGNSGKMPKSGLMNDPWLGQTVKPPKTGQTSHDISGTWTRTNVL